jgi:hypothetical protein
VGNLFINKLILTAVLALSCGSAYAGGKDAKTSEKKSHSLWDKAVGLVKEECIVKNNMALNEMNKYQLAVDKSFQDMIGASIVGTNWLGDTGLIISVIADDKDGTIHIVIRGELPAKNFQPQLDDPSIAGTIASAVLEQLNNTVRPAMKTEAGFSFQVKLCQDEEGTYLDPVASNGGRIRLAKGETGSLIMTWKIPKSKYLDVLRRVGSGS